MGRLTAAFLCFTAIAFADSHPPGVAYPLTPAAIQPAGLAHPLPSTRRYVLVWKDQIIPSNISQAQAAWVPLHYVGTQKLFQSQIDQYRGVNPNFLLLTYHLAYGLNGADQANPVGNITGPNTFGQEDSDTFTPYVAAKGITRENAYQHTTSGMRVSYPDPYWLMDIASTEWRGYLFATLRDWTNFATAHSDGVFLDVAFPPWYNYSPAMWWSGLATDGSRQALDTWWMPRARDYFDAMRAALAAGASGPRQLVIPNPDALVDGTDEPTFLDGTDGVFTENWQSITSGPGDWNLSVRRIARYATSAGKVWMADVTAAGTSLSQPDRELLIGTYLLVRNGTSYIMFGNGDVTWYPEYEIDLGGYLAEPPADIEQLRVGGAGGASGGLYQRDHVAGVVLVNSSAGPIDWTATKAWKRAAWSGGGDVASDGTKPAYSLTYDADVPAGVLSVPARSVVVLRDPAGAPPPGVEPGGPAADGGAGDQAMAPADLAGADLSGRDLSMSGGGDGGGGGASGGCSCAVGGRVPSRSWWIGIGLGLALGLGKRSATRRRAAARARAPRRAP